MNGSKKSRTYTSIRSMHKPKSLASRMKKLSAMRGALGEVDSFHIENITKDQANSEMWKRERHCRLTASNFGCTCKMRRNTSHKNVIHSILYSTFSTNAVQYGKDMEHIAKLIFEEISGYKVKSCGLFIDKEYPYLAASPDGIIDEQKLIEIKAPYAAKDTNKGVEAVETGKTAHMVHKLKTFYLESLVPELVDPAFGHRLMISDIREINSNTAKTVKKKLFK